MQFRHPCNMPWDMEADRHADNLQVLYLPLFSGHRSTSLLVSFIHKFKIASLTVLSMTHAIRR